MPVGTYGRIVSAPMIETAVANTLATWLSDYLGETLAQAGYGREDLPDPDDLVFASDLDWPTEAEVALVVIVSPGTTGDPRREAESYAATWDVRVVTLASLPDRLDTRRAAQLYAAAAGAAVDQKGVELEGATVVWTGEGTRVLAERDARTLVAGEARFEVSVEDARRRYGGPDAPSPPDVPRQPADPAGEVTSVSITLTKEALT